MIAEKTYRRYLDALVDGDRHTCTAIVEQLLPETRPKELYIDLFQASLYRIGELWEQRRISVAIEHLATAITENLLVLVYPAIFGADHINRSVIVSCTHNEHHQIGGKMVADIFEMHGWNAYFLGTNTPLEDLLAMVGAKRPDVVALSLAVPTNLGGLETALRSLAARFPEVPTIIGGQAFRWGGVHVADRYPGCRHIASLHDLETFIAEAS